MFKVTKQYLLLKPLINLLFNKASSFNRYEH